MPERHTYTGWFRAIWWSVCAQCAQRIDEGQWQTLADVPDVGRRWVHEACALQLGPAATSTRPPHEIEERPGRPSADPGQRVSTTPAPAVRIGVLGSEQWPRTRAVEVRDAIEALARGHREVVVVRTARTDQQGRLIGTDAWAQLTAQRLGYRDEPHPDVADVLAADLDLAIAFPLHHDPRADADGPTARSAKACDTRRADTAAAAGIAVFTHE